VINQTIPQSPVSSGGSSNNSNCLLKGCLILLALFLVSCCCLGALVALPFVTDFDPFGIDLRNRFDDVIPWEDFFQDSSQFFDLFDEGFDIFTDEGSSSDSTDTDPKLNDDSTAESGYFRLVPYPEIDFPVTFSYPEGWDISADEYADGVTFFDPDSFTYLSVGRDWIEEGWTAAYVSEKLNETLEFQAQEGTFAVLENTPFIVSTGEDANFNAYEWIDLDDNYQWAYDINIIIEEYNIYFYMVGDDPAYFEMYREMIEAIGTSYRR